MCLHEIIIEYFSADPACTLEFLEQDAHLVDEFLENRPHKIDAQEEYVSTRILDPVLSSNVESIKLLIESVCFNQWDLI